VTSVIILIVTTAATSLYAFLITALADKHPEIAALISLAVVLLWLLVYLWI